MSKKTVLNYEELSKISKKKNRILNRIFPLILIWFLIMPVMVLVFQENKFFLVVVAIVNSYFTFMLAKCIYFSLKERKIFMKGARKEAKKKYEKGDITGALLNEMSAFLPSTVNAISLPISPNHRNANTVFDRVCFLVKHLRRRDLHLKKHLLKDYKVINELIVTDTINWQTDLKQNKKVLSLDHHLNHFTLRADVLIRANSPVTTELIKLQQIMSINNLSLR